MREGFSKPEDCFIQIIDVRMQFSIKAFALGPLRIPPARGIDGKLAEGAHSNASFNGWSHYKWTDADCQFTQFDISAFHRNCIIGSSSKPNPASYTFAMYAGNNKLRTTSHRIDDVRK